MANYPDWVLKYKTKGVYIKKTKDGYSLYKGHSERVAGKKYPVLKCDEYLGIVTEKDGLIPSRPPVKRNVQVRTYGLEYIAENCCSVLRLPLKRRNLDGILLYSHALLSLKRDDNALLYSMSILNLWYGDKEYGRALSNDEQETVIRLRKQIMSKLNKIFGNDTDEAIAMLGGVYAVYVNERWILSSVSGRLEEILEMHGQKMEFLEVLDNGR